MFCVLLLSVAKVARNDRRAAYRGSTSPTIPLSMSAANAVLGPDSREDTKTNVEITSLNVYFFICLLSYT